MIHCFLVICDAHPGRWVGWPLAHQQVAAVNTTPADLLPAKYSRSTHRIYKIGAITGHPQKASKLEVCVDSNLVAQMVLGFGAGSNYTDQSECKTVRDFQAIRTVNTSGFIRAGTERNWYSIWHQKHVWY